MRGKPPVPPMRHGSVQTTVAFTSEADSKTRDERKESTNVEGKAVMKRGGEDRQSFELVSEMIVGQLE